MGQFPKYNRRLNNEVEYDQYQSLTRVPYEIINHCQEAGLCGREASLLAGPKANR
jgi:hypothetical protein